ncbi:MAG: hypothetical protein IJX47_03040 [Clostridia bacterium]|nr:hypothetical protein [Clostridia bacterium]MBQ8382161.1 hypothetical protein [Clostridia bacterium]
MKKLLCSLLATGMMLGVLASCANTEEKKETSPVVSGDSDAAVTDDLPDNLNFEGQDIKILCCDEDITIRSFVADEEDEDIVSSAIYLRNKAIEKRLGVTIEVVETVDHESVASTASLIIQAGGDDYDIIGGYQYFSVGLALNSNLYNLKGEEISSIGYLNFDKPYWSDQFMNNIALDGATYWATGDVSLRYTSGMYCTFVNTQIFNTLFPNEDIYAIAREGQWTMDKLTTMSSQAWVDTNGNQEPDDGDQFGFITGEYDLLDGLAVGCGVTFGAVQDGEIVITLGNDVSRRFADKLQALTRMDSTRMVSVMEQSWCPENFAAGNALFLVDKIMTAASYFDSMENYAIIPAPKLDDNQPTYLTTLQDGITLLGIPSSIPLEKLPGICATMEAMAAGSYNDVTPKYYESALKIQYTRDEASGEMIDLIRENVTTDFVFAYSHEINDIAWYFRSNHSGGSSVLNRKVKSMSPTWESSIATIVEGLRAGA